MTARAHSGCVAWVALWALHAWVLPAGGLFAQTTVLVEDYEFASSDEAAAAGVVDLTDFANSPAVYINGELEDASEGLFSIGTVAAFCTQQCVAGSFIGFRRYVDELRFVDECESGRHYLALQNTYGDPAHPGVVAPDLPLSELTVLCDGYGDGAFSDGPTGTHLWIKLVDCEGEVFEFVNFSEPSLYDSLFTLDVMMGRSFLGISPDSLIDGKPVGDGLLTEIAATELFIQDADDPPTTFGKWYIDNLRIVEPPPVLAGDANGDGTIDLNDLAAVTACLTGPAAVAPLLCGPVDIDDDGDVDLRDVGVFERIFGSGP